MCGIAGFVDTRLSSDPAALRLTVERMTTAIVHRGPDDAGTWVDPTHGLALGFRRLSIVDLTSEGHQPMVSPCGQVVLLFNGEIYNHREVRRELETAGIVSRWRGHSDTEVMVAAIAAWGVDAAVKRFNGMFAFVAWDRSAGRLTLGRDRLGEKPMYYGWSGRSFVFGSELKALRRHPDWRGDVNRGAVARYLRFGYVSGPESIVEGISRVPPGSLTTLSLPAQLGTRPVVTPYWSLRDVAQRGGSRPTSIDDREACDRLDGLLQDATRLRMEADVPLGAFLSGGIDSSTIVAAMQAQSSRPVHTYSIGFEDLAYDEAPFAGAVAEHLGTDHTEFKVGAREAIGIIPRLPELYDEPLGDPSQIPTCLVCALAKRHVTVALSGDGGDELFGGYSRYAIATGAANVARRWPRWVRHPAGALVGAVPTRAARSVVDVLSLLLGTRVRVVHPDRALMRLATLLRHDSLEDIYLQLITLTDAPEELLCPHAPPATFDGDRLWDVLEPLGAMMYADQMSYLPDDILVKVDRASMAVSLECRVPMLDHRLVEWAWTLPTRLRVREGRAKWILREVLHRYVPQSLIDRPKRGFSVPIASWLRGPLLDWAEDLLATDSLGDAQLLEPARVRALWHEHRDGKANHDQLLWTILMLQAWAR